MEMLSTLRKYSLQSDQLIGSHESNFYKKIPNKK
jgi:hypothetical protein